MTGGGPPSAAEIMYLQVQMLIAAGYAVVERMYDVYREPYERFKEHARGAVFSVPMLLAFDENLPSRKRLVSS